MYGFIFGSRCRNYYCSVPKLSIIYKQKNPKQSPIGNSFGLFAFGGGEGSRTPVRKILLPTFYERSCLFDLAFSGVKQHTPMNASPLSRDVIQGSLTFTFTAS